MIDLRKGAFAAWAVAGLSILSIGLGLALVLQLGGTSGQDLGRTASNASWARILPILVAAEVTKLLIAASQATVALAVRGSRGGAWRRLLLPAGLAGSAAVAASGVVGLYATAVERPELTGQTSAFGFWGMAATGLWALMIVMLRPVELRPWQTFLGLALAAASVVPLLIPAVAIAAGLLGLPWWFGLAARLREASRTA